MGAKTNSELITYAKAYLTAGACYWYGGTGSIGTKELYQRKQKQYPNYYPTAQYEATDYYDQDGKIVMDCCGLVKACLNASAPGQPAPYVCTLFQFVSTFNQVVVRAHTFFKLFNAILR